jgi:indole-3-glycerol phosphate synthase
VSFLEQITATRRAEARARKSEISELRARIADIRPTRGFGAAVEAEGLSLIAEIKRSSPSVGKINSDIDPAERAAAYEAGGARAVSVLTEPEYFSGSLADLAAARKACELPIIRKDFLSEELHLLEARAIGADAVLLIVAALAASELADLHAMAGELGLDALVEVHDEDEVGIAMDAGARIIGVNTRNLKTLEVDPGQVARVRPAIPPGVSVVGESGIKAREDVTRLEDIGVDAILVGETLMRSTDVGAAIDSLLGRVR